MQVSVESPSAIQRRMTIIVPVELVDKEYNNQLVKLSKKVKINGFRPGKIPLDVIKQRYDDSVRHEALSEVIRTSLTTAIDQEKLQPVDTPKIEPKASVPGQPLEFVATFEVLPTVESVNFDLTSLEKQVATINEEDIDYAYHDKRLLYNSYYTHPEDVIGNVAIHTTNTGTVFTKKNVQAPLLVYKNQPVDIIARNTFIVVSMKGIAKSDGRMNDSVKVFNPSSKKTIDAVVIGASQTLVTS